MFALVGKAVLAAIQFDVQFRFLAKEIENVFSDGMLAAKLVAAEPPVTQPMPHQLFRPSVILAKLPRTLDVGHNGNLGNGRKTGKFVLTRRGERFLPLLGERAGVREVFTRLFN